MTTAVLFVSLTILLLLGVPIGISLALAMVLMVAYEPVTPMTYIAQSLYTGVASFTLLSLPFFMIAGSIMETGGLSKRLVGVANSMVGNVTGGLGAVAILSCLFFGAVSGSAAATVAAVGTVMIPQMVKAGYDKYYATALLACAGGLGIIVPPSYPMVIYGVTNDVSIGNLFLAGIGPSLFVAASLMLVNYLYSKKHGYKGSGESASVLGFLRAGWDAKWALLMPVIILGGIYGGIFTPTEAAVVSVLYGIIVGLFIHKELTWIGVWKVFKTNVAVIGGICITFAPAAAMGAIFAYIGFPEAVKEFFLGISTNLYVVMLLILLLMFVVGMFVQTTPAIVIFSPILLPVVAAVGVHPIQFGIAMIICLELAFVTPPVAVNLFVASSLTGLPIDRIFKKTVWFLSAIACCMLLISYIPKITFLLLDVLGISY